MVAPAMHGVVLKITPFVYLLSVRFEAKFQRNVWISKVVLLHSGGLDTGDLADGHGETHQCEVVTFTADLGQGEEVKPAR